MKLNKFNWKFLDKYQHRMGWWSVSAIELLHSL